MQNPSQYNLAMNEAAVHAAAVNDDLQVVYVPAPPQRPLPKATNPDPLADHDTWWRLLLT